MNHSCRLDVDKDLSTGEKLIDGVLNAVSNGVRVQYRPLAGHVHGEVDQPVAAGGYGSARRKLHVVTLFEFVEEGVELRVFFLGQRLREQRAQRFLEQLVPSPQNIEAHRKRDDWVEPQPIREACLLYTSPRPRD